MCTKCTTTARALLHQVYQCVRIGGEEERGRCSSLSRYFLSRSPLSVGTGEKIHEPASYLYCAFVLYLYLY